MELKKPKSKTEKRLIIVCSLCMLMCLIVLFFGEDWLWNSDGFLSNKQKVGLITSQTNDARLKNDGSFVWYKAKEQGDVRIGDAVFSGADSKVHVELQSGGGIDVGENSLLVFSEIESQKLANLMSGNFRLKVDGTLKVAVNGEITTLNGRNSEVQIYFDKDKKPKFRTLSGNVKWTGQKTAEAAKPKSLPVEIPSPMTVPSESYTWHLYDLYEQKNLELIVRVDLPAKVQRSTELKWSSGNSKSTLVQYSENSDFSSTTQSISSSGFTKLETVHLGENFWRVSADEGKTWSVSQKFQVVPQFLKNAQSVLIKPIQEIPLFENVASFDLEIRTPVEAEGLVAEASTTAEFSLASTKIFWSKTSRPRLSFYQPGQYFYRFRTVTKNQELSDWSNVQKFIVFKPEPLKVPVLAKINSRELYIGEVFKLDWKSDAKMIVTEVLTKEGKHLEKIAGRNITWTAPEAGLYRIRSLALDKYGRTSAFSKTEILKVLPKLIPSRLSKNEVKARKPTAVETTTSIKLEDIKDVEPRNSRYKNSVISAQGFLWTLQSSQQVDQSKAAPVASGIGVHGITWFDRWGLEGSAKASLLSGNQASAQTSMRDFEGRIHYRFVTGFPFGMARELQTSVFAGYEMYSNVGSSFASQYDLIKFGTSLEFPLSQRWSTGGEFVYGYGLDKGSKQEISGNLNYFLTPDWSLGAGYRFNFYTAGSAASVKMGYYSYKEGYTEGYSILNYHF
jgi:hypothetical protein